jgi:hypothetical protein
MPRVLTPGVLALVSGAALATNLVLVWAAGTRIFLDGYLVRGAAVVAIAVLLFRSNRAQGGGPEITENQEALATRNPLTPKRLLVSAVGVGIGFLTWAAPGLSVLLAGATFLLWAFVRTQPAEERRFLYGFAAFALGGRLLLVAIIFLVLSQMGRVYGYLDPDLPSQVPMLFGDGADRTLLSQGIAQAWRGLWVAPATLVEMGRAESSLLFVHSDARHLLPQVLFFYFFGDEVIASKMITAVVGFAASLFGFALARRAFGSTTARACAILLAFFPTSLVWSLDMLKEPYYALMLMGAAWSLFVALGERRPAAYVLAAAFVFGAFLVRGRWGATLLAAVGLGAFLVAVIWAFSRLRPRARVLLVVGLVAGSIVLLRSPPVHRTLLGLGALYYDYHRSQEKAGGTTYRIWPDRYYEKEVLDFRAEWSLGDLSLAYGRGLYHFWLEPLPGKLGGLKGAAANSLFVIWIAGLVAAVFGLRQVWRRQRTFAVFLLAYLVVDVQFLVLYEANVFTLVRHRETLTPLVLFLSGAGAASCFGHFRAKRVRPQSLSPHQQVEP